MSRINRRRFLALAGAGTAAAAAGTVSGVVAATTTGRDVLTFRASAALPAAPLAAYATYVLEGHVDLAAGTGMLTRSVLAGAPGATSAVALPGLSRMARVTAVREVAGVLTITGLVHDRSQLNRGETPELTVRLDRGAGVALASFNGSPVRLRLEA
jgi:hypothetical protein